MGLGDKISNAKDEAVGKAKEAWGDLTDNESLEAEGRAEQLEAEGKQKVESAKDHLNDAGDKVGYLTANVAYALKRPELKAGLMEYLREVVAKDSAK